MGTHFRVTRSRGFWVRTLDGRPASEAYAHLFGYPAREWAFPPLDHMARLYPLGLEQLDKSLLLRSPPAGRGRRVVPHEHQRVGRLGRLPVDGQALKALEGARPVLALVLADIAWQMLFEAQPGGDVSAVQAVLGLDVPVAGGYTLGQIVPGGEGTPQFLNQHVVVVFGEPEEKEK